jgi:hypothetical protein
MKTLVIEGENEDFTMMRHGKNIKGHGPLLRP